MNIHIATSPKHLETVISTYSLRFENENDDFQGDGSKHNKHRGISRFLRTQ